MANIKITVTKIRRANDCNVNSYGTQIGDLSIKFCDVHSLNVKRRFLIGRREVIIVTDLVNYHIRATHATIDNFIEALTEAWSDYQENSWIDKSV